MNYKILFHPEAEKEFFQLDNRVRILVSKQLVKIATSPLLGEELGNKQGYNLAGYRKMYVDNKRIRIVYFVQQESILVKVIAIGKRDSFDVYKTADERLAQV